jgi:hypothetical protein
MVWGSFYFVKIVDFMPYFIESTTKSLETLVSELADNPSFFLRNPSADFSRKRKIDFITLIGITINSWGCTLSKEFLDFFNFNVNPPTVSAYTKQLSKVLLEAF